MALVDHQLFVADIDLPPEDHTFGVVMLAHLEVPVDSFLVAVQPGDLAAVLRLGMGILVVVQSQKLWAVGPHDDSFVEHWVDNLVKGLVDHTVDNLVDLDTVGLVVDILDNAHVVGRAHAVEDIPDSAVELELAAEVHLVSQVVRVLVDLD